MSTILFLFSQFIGPVLAGTVLIETDGAMKVQHGGVTIARATGPGTLNLGEMAAGPTVLTVIREGKSPIETTVNVPEEGHASLTLKDKTLSVDGTAHEIDELPPPVVVLRGAEGQRFSVIIDGKKRGVLNGELAIEDLEPGMHTLEFRTEDNLVIWARGRLELQPADTVSLTISEGRTVEVGGRTSAWQPPTVSPRTGY